MEADFWHQRWKNNEIGFHGKTAHPLLVKHLPDLRLGKGARIFLPLCGKTLDIHWLLDRGYQVIGAELSKLAVEQLFAELGMSPTVTNLGTIQRYRARNLDILVGDIFSVTQEQLGSVDALYDRAALVALPETMRNQYASHLIALTLAAPQLIISFEYDQTLMAGPPFSIRPDEITQHYGNSYNITLVDKVEIPGGLKGKLAAQEDIWLLRPKSL